MGSAAEQLFELLEQRLVPGMDLESLDRQIWARFGQTCAVLCSDMSGFMRGTEQAGILHFLSLIARMQQVMRPVVERHGGVLIKFVADNLLAVFADPLRAVRCARQMHRTMARQDAESLRGSRIFVCVGIGYGRILKVGDEDCFGSEVNVAFKLGEDVAKPGETLLSPAALAALPARERRRFEAVEPGAEAPVARYFRLRTLA